MEQERHDWETSGSNLSRSGRLETKVNDRKKTTEKKSSEVAKGTTSWRRKTAVQNRPGQPKQKLGQ